MGICLWLFSVNYDSIDFDDILDFHRYLMKKHNISKVFKKFLHG